MTAVTTAHCGTCKWTADGDPVAVDKAAEKHTKATGHATGVVSVPHG